MKTNGRSQKFFTISQNFIFWIRRILELVSWNIQCNLYLNAIIIRFVRIHKCTYCVSLDTYSLLFWRVWWCQTWSTDVNLVGKFIVTFNSSKNCEVPESIYEDFSKERKSFFEICYLIVFMFYYLNEIFFLYSCFFSNLSVKDNFKK